MASPVKPLSDADIERLAKAQPLSDDDIAAHEQPPERPGFFETIWNDVKSTPTFLRALYHDPVGTIDTAVHGFVNLPDTLAREYEAGNKAQVLAHMTELAAPIAAEAVPPVLRGVARAPGKVLEMASKPGAPQLIKGTLQAGVGAGMALEGHPLIGGGVGLRGIQNIQKGLEEWRAGRIPPLFDDLADALVRKGTKYADLSLADQARVRSIAERIETPTISLGKPPSSAAPANPPIYFEPSRPNAGKTVADLIQEEYGRKPVAPVPPPPAVEKPVGVAQPGGVNVPLRPPLRTEPTPAQGVAEALTGTREGGTIPAPETTPPDVFEARNRALKADRLATWMDKTGISYGDAKALTPEHLTDREWEAVLNTDPETLKPLGGQTLHAPSQESIDAAVQELAKRQAVGKKPEALENAKMLQKSLEEE